MGSKSDSDLVLKHILCEEPRFRGSKPQGKAPKGPSQEVPGRTMEVPGPLNILLLGFVLIFGEDTHGRISTGFGASCLWIFFGVDFSVSQCCCVHALWSWLGVGVVSHALNCVLSVLGC